MPRFRHGVFVVIALLSTLVGLGKEPQPSGPQAEKRFPPLQLPAGFQATLFACDPFIEYPSVISLGPRTGAIFVAADYMTGLGADIVRRDEIRLLEDTDGDGYADKQTVVAGGFGSIQGLAYHDGMIYVMHAPRLTAVPYDPKTGKAGQQRHLFTGFGLPPEKDQVRLHNANGVVVGHDGWLYLALGDRGVDVQRPEGDRLVLEGGGILRCRPDGSDLHVFCSGLRNIYDLALDEDLNVFVRDNENDGGTYKIRVCHSFFGADHGYPYLYDERPDEALAPIADLGLGSSAGVGCYLERQFPPEFRGNLFACEWGRAVVRYDLRRAGESFAPVKEITFAAGAANDPYGFKPTDLVVDRDGSLFVSDWADGQRPKRGRGRIYRIRHAGKSDDAPAAKVTDDTTTEELVKLLDSESHHARWQAQEALMRRGAKGILAAARATQLGVRGRMHAIWTMAHAKDGSVTERLLAMAKSQADPRVRVQALRALVDRVDPVLTHHKLAAGTGAAADVARQIAELAAGGDPLVQLEAVIALGRLGWSETPAWLRKHLKQPGPALAHAAQMTLRRVGNWPEVLKLLDAPATEPIRAIALRACAEQYDPTLVGGLIERLGRDPDPARRLEYASTLARVYRERGPWVYWGFRPQPRPANTLAWERTDAIQDSLDKSLPRLDAPGRAVLLGRMTREKVPARSATLVNLLRDERGAQEVKAILGALGQLPIADAAPLLDGIVRDRRQATDNRVLAVSLLAQGHGAKGKNELVATAQAVEDGPVLAALLKALGGQKSAAGVALLLGKLASADAEVRARACAALAEAGARDAARPILKLLGDSDARVRSAAALAAGTLRLEANEQLLKLAKDADGEVRRSSLESLRNLREPRALPVAVAALGDPHTSLQALDVVAELGGPEQAKAVTDVARSNPALDVLAAVGRTLTGWLARPKLSPAERRVLQEALAEIHGSSGMLVGWQVRGPDAMPISVGEAAKLLERTDFAGSDPGWRAMLSTGPEARVRLTPAASGAKAGAWLALCEATASEAFKADFFAASTGMETIWLNDKVVFRRNKPGVVGPYPDRFEAELRKGTNRILVSLTGVSGAVEFALRLRRKSAKPEHERLTLSALSRAGNPEAGRQVFLNAEKSQCIKCHRVGEQGEKFGPELTGLGSRFPKVYIVESILEPSRTIAPSFETTSFMLKNGKVLAGLKVAETERELTIVDSQIQKHVLAKTDIEEQARHTVSTMPEGLEKRLSEDEFVDLISYLVNLKEGRK